MMEHYETLIYNRALHNESVILIARFVRRFFPDSDAPLLIGHLSKVENFPFFKVRDVVKAAKHAGVDLTPKIASVDEVTCHHAPALISISNTKQPHAREIVALVKVREECVILSRNLHSFITLSLDEFSKRFSGVIFLAPSLSGWLSPDEDLGAFIGTYRSGFFSQEQCRGLRQYFEAAKPYHMTPTHFIGGLAGQDASGFGLSCDILDMEAAAIDNVRKHVASFMGCNVGIIEGPFLRRLDEGSRIPTHFDNGVSLGRIRALHVSFGGEGSIIDVTTSFPFKQKTLSGSDAITFVCGDEYGRTRWNSEWSAVTRGCPSYLASFWITPRRGASAGLRTSG